MGEFASEDNLLVQWCENETPVEIGLFDGLILGEIRSVFKNAILVETTNGKRLIYKHAIRFIKSR